MAVKQESHVRVWRATLDASAGIMLSPDSIVMAGDRDNFISLSNQGVNIITGSLHFSTDPMNISKGILFAEQLGFLQVLPSNVTMPIPNCSINIPGKGMLLAIGKNLAVCAAI